MGKKSISLKIGQFWSLNSSSIVNYNFIFSEIVIKEALMCNILPKNIKRFPRQSEVVLDG